MNAASHRRLLMALAGAGSATLLLGAFGFQYLGGFLPCAMCLWQRWPHVAAVALGLIGSAVPHRAIAALGGLTMLGNSGLGLFHTGVERGWWEGPNTCSGSASQDLSGMSGADLLDFTTGPQIVMCDQVSWSFLGLSMASYNAIFCLVLALIWLQAARRRA